MTGNLQVQCHRLLAGMQRTKPSSIPPFVQGRRVAEEIRAVGRLDAHYASAEPSKVPSAHRPWQQARQIDHAYIIEGTGGTQQTLRGLAEKALECHGKPDVPRNPQPPRKKCSTGAQ